MNEEAVTKESPASESDTTQEAASSPSMLDSLKNGAPEDKQKWLNTFTDDKGLANSIFSMVEMTGKKGDIPAADASDEQKAAYLEKVIGGDPDKSGVEFSPELTERLGDHAKASMEEFNGFRESSLTLFREELSKTPNDIVGAYDRAFDRFAEADIIRQLENATEAQAAQEQALKEVAAKVGLAPEKLVATQKEVMGKFGWDETTTAMEVLHKLAEVTSDSTTLKESRLNSTQGLQVQIDELRATDEFRQDGPKHALAVQKMTRLLKQQFELEQKNA